MQVRPGGKFVSLVFVIGVLLFFTGTAAAQQVVYNFIPGTDFSKYHTYKWLQITCNVRPNQIVDQEIIDAINNVLSSKGFTLATGDNADLYVGYQCSVDQEREWSAWGTGGGLRRGGLAQRLVPRLQMERSLSISVIRPRNSWSGADRLRIRSILAAIMGSAST